MSASLRSRGLGLRRPSSGLVYAATHILRLRLYPRAALPLGQCRPWRRCGIDASKSAGFSGEVTGTRASQKVRSNNIPDTQRFPWGSLDSSSIPAGATKPIEALLELPKYQLLPTFRERFFDRQDEMDEQPPAHIMQSADPPP